MVELAAPRSGETVIDLGSGDGRIVFAAVEGRPGVRMTLPGLGFTQIAFVGHVRGDTIEGSAEAVIPLPGEEEATDHVRVPWHARRTAAPGYFAPTGTGVF
jgi:hypothetical protein